MTQPTISVDNFVDKSGVEVPEASRYVACGLLDEFMST